MKGMILIIVAISILLVLFGGNVVNPYIVIAISSIFVIVIAFRESSVYKKKRWTMNTTEGHVGKNKTQTKKLDSGIVIAGLCSGIFVYWYTPNTIEGWEAFTIKDEFIGICIAGVIGLIAGKMWGFFGKAKEENTAHTEFTKLNAELDARVELIRKSKLLRQSKRSTELGVQTELDCHNKRLTKLDVSKNTAQPKLVCNYKQLTELDLSKDTALTYLNCSNNQLTKLDVRKNTKLTTLFCFDNQLKALDLSKNTALTELKCQSNQFNAAALNRLFGTLHGNTISGVTKTVFIKNNPGTDACDTSIAEANGWKVLKS